MPEIEIEAKTVEEAIHEGLIKIGCSRENVEIKILNEGTIGLFGLMGTKPAKVRLTTRDASLARPDIDYVLTQSSAKEYLANILKLMHVDFDEINTSLMAGRVMVDIKTKESNLLIGKNGQTLEAIEAVTNLMLSREPKTRTKALVDIEGYRQRQDERLQALAKKSAEQVRTTGNIFKFDPMSSRDRRVIHLTLKNDPDIDTFSEGDGAYRRVVIKPKK